MKNSNGGTNGNRSAEAALVIVSHQSLTRKSNSHLKQMCRVMLRKKKFTRVFSTNIALKNRLESIAKRIHRDGIRRIEVFPYFLHNGFHVRVELPKRLRVIRRLYPGLRVLQCPHLGSHPALATLVLELTGPRKNRPPVIF